VSVIARVEGIGEFLVATGVSAFDDMSDIDENPRRFWDFSLGARRFCDSKTALTL
jgi:hypothetical protein